MSAPPYNKLDEERSANISDDCDMLDAAPPPYTDTPMADLRKSPEPLPAPGIYPAPPGSYDAYPSAGVYPPPVAYPLQQPHQVLPQMAPPPQIIQHIAPPAAPAVTTVNVVTGGMLPPGTCSVCRKGKIKDTASCCTWFWCLLLLPLGIIPGIIAFCCCCRHPKCNHCGFSV